MGAGAGGWGAGVLVSCQTPAVARRRGDEHNDPFCEGTKERGGEREALILPYICLALQGTAFGTIATTHRASLFLTHRSS